MPWLKPKGREIYLYLGKSLRAHCFLTVILHRTWYKVQSTTDANSVLKVTSVAKWKLIQHARYLQIFLAANLALFPLALYCLQKDFSRKSCHFLLELFQLHPMALGIKSEFLSMACSTLHDLALAYHSCLIYCCFL